MHTKAHAGHDSSDFETTGKIVEMLTTESFGRGSVIWTRAYDPDDEVDFDAMIDERAAFAKRNALKIVLL